jgi:hypothetical protein
MTNPDPEAIADIESLAFDAVLAELDDIADAAREGGDILVGSPEWLILRKVKDVAAQLEIARDLGDKL